MRKHNPSRPGTKQALITDMLRAQGGVSTRELVAATGWQANTVRSAITTLRKLGCEIAVDRTKDVFRYRLLS